MSGCQPKSVVCGSYIPDFTPGGQSCKLKSYTLTRARLESGGTFFRTKNVNFTANKVSVSCTWLAQSGTYMGDPPDVDRSQWEETTIQGDVEWVEFIVSYDSSPVETYYEEQSYSSGWLPTSHGAITGLRTQINNNADSLIEMPTLDTPGGWISSSGDDDHIGYFSDTFLTGGGGNAPVAPSSAIRTGPAYTMIYISASQRNVANGSTTTLNPGEIWYWGVHEPDNVLTWLKYDPSKPDCFDPNNLKLGQTPCS